VESIVLPETVVEKLNASRKLSLDVPDEETVTVAVLVLDNDESNVDKSICNDPIATLVALASTVATDTSRAEGAVNDARKLVAAFAGTVEINPKPNADTATSAMRLRSVFVDICFLSISRTEEFPQFGLN
jgi:hypothetical protein